MGDKSLPHDNCVVLAKMRGKMNDNDGDKGGPGDEGTVGADCDHFGLVEGELRELGGQAAYLGGVLAEVHGEEDEEEVAAGQLGSQVKITQGYSVLHKNHRGR
jgi:hypothetical protein